MQNKREDSNSLQSLFILKSLKSPRSCLVKQLVFQLEVSLSGRKLVFYGEYALSYFYIYLHNLIFNRVMKGKEI